MEAIVAMVIFVILFLIFRAFVLWYWRINEMADTLHEISLNIAKLANSQPTRLADDSQDMKTDAIAPVAD